MKPYSATLLRGESTVAVFISNKLPISAINYKRKPRNHHKAALEG